MKDYTTITINPFKEEFQDDEYLNNTLYLNKILACTVELYKLLDNAEIIALNKLARENQAILSAEKEARDLSSKANKNEANRQAMFLAHKKAIFLRHQLISKYVFAKYINPNNNKITGRTGGKAK